MDTQAASVYFRLLGELVYREPNAQDIEMLQRQKLFDELPYAACDECAIRGQKLMSDWLGRASADELASAAKSDWLLLMMGIDDVIAPPWGSVYLDKDKLLFAEHTLFVRRYYEHYGFELKRKYREPDDHLGLELEFVSCLLEEGKIAASREFIGTYMRPWIDTWAQGVQAHAKTDYYRALAWLIVGGLQCFTEDAVAA